MALAGQNQSFAKRYPESRTKSECENMLWTEYYITENFKVSRSFKLVFFQSVNIIDDIAYG